MMEISIASCNTVKAFPRLSHRPCEDKGPMLLFLAQGQTGEGPVWSVGHGLKELRFQFLGRDLELHTPCLLCAESLIPCVPCVQH